MGQKTAKIFSKSPLTKGDFCVIICFVGVGCKVILVYTLKGVYSGMRDDMTILYDIYGELLSKSQREVLDLRYNSDLSIAEIAEELGGISRPAVNNARKKGEERLLELEGILGSAKRYKEISDLLSQAEENLARLPDGGNDGDIIKRIREIFEDIRKRL